MSVVLASKKEEDPPPQPPPSSAPPSSAPPTQPDYYYYDQYAKWVKKTYDPKDTYLNIVHYSWSRTAVPPVIHKCPIRCVLQRQWSITERSWWWTRVLYHQDTYSTVAQNDAIVWWIVFAVATHNHELRVPVAQIYMCRSNNQSSVFDWVVFFWSNNDIPGEMEHTTSDVRAMSSPKDILAYVQTQTNLRYGYSFFNRISSFYIIPRQIKGGNLMMGTDFQRICSMNATSTPSAPSAPSTPTKPHPNQKTDEKLVSPVTPKTKPSTPVINSMKKSSGNIKTLALERHKPSTLFSFSPS